MSLKVFPDTKKQNGYGSKQNFVTGQPMEGSRIGMDVVQKACADIETITSTVIDKNIVTLPGNSAQPGMLLQHVTSGHEFTIVGVVGNDVYCTIDVDPTYAGDDFAIKRYVTFKTDLDGSTVVNVTSAPISFIKDTVDTQVTEDTVTPANNDPLPSKMFIQKDGATYPVNKDTGTPANTVAVPVEIVQASGTEINITAGDINVQTTHLGPNADSMRIGDGVNEMGVNASNEALTHDQDVLDAFTAGQLARVASLGVTISTEDQATQDAILAAFTAGQAASAASAPVVLSTEQEAILQSIASSGSALIGSLFSHFGASALSTGTNIYTAILPVKKAILQNQSSDILRLEIDGTVVGHVLQGGELSIDVAGLTGDVLVFGQTSDATGNFSINLLG